MILKKVSCFFLKSYSRFVSPFFGKNCRFDPSCSLYANLAIERYGFFRGGLLTILRLLRCNPFFEGGYDPVPDKRIKCKCVRKKNG